MQPFWGAQERENTERADELLQRFRLDHMRDEFAGNLSGGQRKLLEMARALMADPTLIMLDEPMAGVNPALKQSLLAAHPIAQGGGPDGAVRRARHGHGPRDQRLGAGDGRGSVDRRGHRHADLRQPGRDRRLPRRSPRGRPRGDGRGAGDRGARSRRRGARRRDAPQIAEAHHRLDMPEPGASR